MEESNAVAAEANEMQSEKTPEKRAPPKRKVNSQTNIIIKSDRAEKTFCPVQRQVWKYLSDVCPLSECSVVITITTIDALASFCVEISLFFIIPSLWDCFVGLRTERRSLEDEISHLNTETGDSFQVYLTSHYSALIPQSQLITRQLITIRHKNARTPSFVSTSRLSQCSRSSLGFLGDFNYFHLFQTGQSGSLTV